MPRQVLDRVLTDWLRTRPLAAGHERGSRRSHGACWPKSQRSADDALQLAAEVSQRLAREPRAVFAAQMYGDEPARWQPQLDGDARTRIVINVLTR
jgi:bis(5'-nucleosyl)-tetraphosphatase (symmetrical)